MRFLDLYLYANIYILFFWMFYKIFVNRSNLFHRNRMYILSALIFSLFLPILQNKLSVVLESSQLIGTSLNPINFIYKSGVNAVPGLESGTALASLEIQQIISLILITGSLLTFGYLLMNHITIKILIKKSQLLSQNKNRIFLCDEEIVPFIYNDTILIPSSTPISDRELIIKHESQHYHFGHHYDNNLIQLFQMIFWANPFFYLLKNYLREVHEYQVDESLLSLGIDATQYKLALVKFRAGYQKFAMANGLSTNLKNRLIMMNSDQNPKGNWKVLLSIPALSFLFLTLSFSNVTPLEKPVTLNMSEISQEIDSVEIEIIPLPAEFEIAHPKDAILVLMNKASHVAVDGSLAKEGTRIDMIIRKYNALREDRFFKNLEPDVKIITMKDMATDENDYKALLDEISTAIYTMHESWAKKNYDKPFKDLNDEQQAKILEMVPPKIYQAAPKRIKPQPTKK